MKQTNDLLREARRILTECETLVPEIDFTEYAIRFKVSARLTRAAGKARPRTGEITLSLPFFEDDGNFEKEFRNTVTHEIAHVLSPPTRNPGSRKRSSHGFAWKAMHRRLGGTGDRCHTLDLAVGYERKTRPRAARTDAPCPKCGQPMSLGPKQLPKHRAIVAMGGQGYTHSRCPR